MSKKENHVVVSGLESFQRMALGFMPGGHVIEEFINFRSKLKQKRILDFAESLKDFFKKYQGDIPNDEQYTSEEFIDLFEAIISKVQATNSLIKLEYFRNILISQLTDSSVNEILSNKIIQTVDELNDLQLIILLIIIEQKAPSTIYGIHLKIEQKNVYIRLNKNDELPIGTEMESVLESSILIYFLEELIRMGLIEEVEIGGEVQIPSREMEDAYYHYLDRKKQLSNTRIVYVCSSYGKLICDFIKTP